MLKSLLRSTAAATLIVSASAGLAFAQDEGQTIAELAGATESLSTLASAVEAAGLAETLGGEGPYTVFAPTNEAFEALPDGTLDTLLEEENQAQLQGILTYHVVETEATSDAVVQMIEDDGGEHPVTTVNGAELTLSMDGETVVITDAAGNTATVTQADIEASNGVVHVIDAVLMPEAM
ncbi:fasciclin domain-containing protein [Inquilinus sp. CAU 1745]|uniref:fasciclin domain-containing protein n=1 Tax=Inquilinus sp. CAU 1745 TaxID=3140369 RepID=UPI00325BC6A9